MNLIELDDNSRLSNPQSQHRLFGRPERPLPLVQMVKGNCHWYYSERSVGDRNFRQELSWPASPKRVASVVAGSFHRYLLEPSLTHLIRPLKSQGHEVDYFVSLTAKPQKAYRSNSGCTDSFTWNPLFRDICQRRDSTCERFEKNALTWRIISSVLSEGVSDV